MIIFKRDDLSIETLPGREIQKGVGKDGFSPSGKITMGFARYSEDSGIMEPHHHAEEVCYVLSAQNGWIRYGPSPENLSERIVLEAGMTIHNPELEWHVFGFEKGGHVEIIFIYGQVDKIRPEEMDA